MRHKFPIMVAVGLALLGGNSACRGQQSEQDSKVVIEEELSAPGDSSVINETWIFFADEPNKGFDQAKTHFLAEGTKSTVFEIRRAAAYLKLEAARGSTEKQTGLQTSIDELEDLADDVENGVVTTVDGFEEPFARAQLALAKFHQRMTAATWARKEYKKAGEELQAAAANLEHAAEWAGHTLDSTAQTALRDSRTAAKALIEGTGWNSAEIQKGMTELQGETEKVNHELPVWPG
jgi:chromosome segregation ATPase